MSENQTSHPFERTIGLGPYRIVGFFALVLPSEANQGRNNFHLAPKTERGCGTCAHCGTGIINNFIVETSDGKRYPIGSDCIEKVGLPVQELTKMKRIERERAKKQRQERKKFKGEAARLELKQLVESQSETLKNIQYRVGVSMYQYATFCIEKSSDGGIVFALNTVKNSLSKAV